MDYWKYTDTFQRSTDDKHEIVWQHIYANEYYEEQVYRLVNELRRNKSETQCWFVDTFG